MESYIGSIFYALLFLVVYVQVFFLYTFFENRHKIIARKGTTKLKEYQGITIIVPCWNEENTIDGTVRSLLELNYPKDKLDIFLIDDGSTDGTWQKLQEYEGVPNISIFHKDNGGKHTALNLGLSHTKTDFVGCLDADSFADKESLARIMSYFEKDKDTMAVAPSIIVDRPKTIIQRAQNAEYHMSVYLKKMLGFMGGIHVTPGPLTIFRKKVFDDLGPYRKAHNTEDMEIAYRMQKHGYKIEQCNDAYVYTNTPNTVKKLYRQRLRWIYGFINNTIDYRKILFRPKYGNFSLFTVPSGIISIVGVTYLFSRFVYNLGEFLYERMINYQAIGFELNVLPSSVNFDPFFLNTQSALFITIFLYSLVFSTMVLGVRMAGRMNWRFPLDMICFFAIYSIIAPFWLLRAIYNTALSKKPSWR